MAKFSDLPLSAQRELISDYRKRGINDISEIIADYDKEVPSDTTASLSQPSLPFSLAEVYRSGGKIHIKPENRGKFTALKKRTGKSASWFKAHGTPAQKKMAVFALNARKWKHEDGGFLRQYPDGGRVRGNRSGKAFVTNLGKRKERKFQDWYSSIAPTLSLNPNPDAYEQAYDYRGYWLNNPDADVSTENFHFPDTWKQPHHPTFSDESVYAEGREGIGHWEGDTFIPGYFNNIMAATEMRPPTAMKTDVGTAPYAPSDSILEYIKDTEAFRDKWYQDGNGVWTVGYGFTGDRVRGKYPNGMSKDEADAYFSDVVNRMLPSFIKATPNFDKLNQNQRDSLFSYYYNIGHGGYTTKSPAMQEALRKLDLEGVVNNIDFGYNDSKNRGLRKRRDYERNLFNTPLALGGRIAAVPAASSSDILSRSAQGLTKRQAGRILNDAVRKTIGAISVTPQKWYKKYGLGSNENSHAYGGSNLYPIGGPIGIQSVPIRVGRKLAKKYVTDYINKGGVEGYPENIFDWAAYAVSPYKDTDLSWHRGKDYDMARRALLAKYMGVTEGLAFNPDDYIEESPYKPSQAEDPNAKYYRPIPKGEYHTAIFDAVSGNFKLDKGEDEKGRYASFYDIWDLAPFSGKGNELGGTPVELYDRVYENEDPFTYYMYFPSDKPSRNKK